MPFGNRSVDVGMMSRDAMIFDGILPNSEAWHPFQKRTLKI